MVSLDASFVFVLPQVSKMSVRYYAPRPGDYEHTLSHATISPSGSLPVYDRLRDLLTQPRRRTLQVLVDRDPPLPSCLNFRRNLLHHLVPRLARIVWQTQS